METWYYLSIVGTWTWVKAEYSNQLEYNGLDEGNKKIVFANKRYFITGELLNMSNGIRLSYITKISEYIHPLWLIIKICGGKDNLRGHFNPS